MSLTSRFFNQWKKPSGKPGLLLARILNVSHEKGIDWGLSHISIGKEYSILDVGCGGGGAVKKMASIAINGIVYGLDFSEECVQVSQKVNSEFIGKGRVRIQQGSVSDLSFPNDMFDLVTAINSHYYWPNLEHDLKEVLRVIKPNGKLLIIGETYKGSKYVDRDRQFVDLLHLAYHSKNELSEIIMRCGFTDIQIFEEYNKGWICEIGRKPL